MLYDLAGLSPEIREAMKTEASRIFLAAGVDLEWVGCEIAGNPMNLAECAVRLGPDRLMLQLFPGVNKADPTAAGFAVLQGGSGVFACVYPERVRELAHDANWDFGDLLGHAAAHELGHLLLRSSAHARAGVMRANRRRTCGRSRTPGWSSYPGKSGPFILQYDCVFRLKRGGDDGNPAHPRPRDRKLLDARQTAVRLYDLVRSHG